MAYAAMTKPGPWKYIMDVAHTSGKQAVIIFQPYAPIDPMPSEAEADALFQTFLDRIMGMPGVTLLKAEKEGDFFQQVTPTP